MRVLSGIACGFLWFTFLVYLASIEVQIDANTVLLTTAIIIAGGMAGGD